MIEVADLRKRYGEIDALKGISFSINKGEIVGFLGPNGAGKSTCLKIMTCFIPPTSGSVRIGGLDVQEHSRAVRKRFGYLPENAPLYSDMVAYDYLKFVGALRGVASRKLAQRIPAVAEQCGVTDVLGQVVGTLSKGYRQRLCLAQALIHDPEILVLDEPTVGLDPNQVVEIRSLIKDLGKERTVILSTHILPEVLVTCDRIVIIHRGKIVANGTPRELQEAQASNPPVVLRIGADGLASEAVAAVLTQQPWAGAVRMRPVGLAGELEFEIAGRGADDLRERVVALTTAQKWRLLEVRRELLDLEGIFRKSTQE
ncbi:MAG: ATP-binding cassette domain-containing protein [Deltaproteobacteria bacterium]|nr:ATP-binding cassette domain-containing protein [Deltaproteobacteria bacterium]